MLNLGQCNAHTQHEQLQKFTFPFGISTHLWMLQRDTQVQQSSREIPGSRGLAVKNHASFGYNPRPLGHICACAIGLPFSMCIYVRGERRTGENEVSVSPEIAATRRRYGVYCVPFHRYRVYFNAIFVRPWTRYTYSGILRVLKDG